jgi:HD-GYP domain-containing protein (c-di-GMP phosphodiesterase class II)
MYDRYTGEHSAQTAQASAALARRLGLRDREVQAAWWAGTLHDLGKLSVPIDVLQKPGPLSETEWSEMRRHPVVGSNALLAISPSFALIASAVRTHHERWDGDGYPDQLAGEEIPLLGRIVALANAFDSMTRRLPHRLEVLRLTAAIRELQCHSGSQFDPALVSLFVELHSNGQIKPW